MLPFTEIGSDKDFDVVFPQERDIADLLFTTGTTGMPKGVVLSYSNQLSAVNNINTFIGIIPKMLNCWLCLSVILSAW